MGLVPGKGLELLSSTAGVGAVADGPPSALECELPGSVEGGLAASVGGTPLEEGGSSSVAGVSTDLRILSLLVSN